MARARPVTAVLENLVVEQLDLVGCEEVAARLQVQVGTVYQWRKRGLLPDAVELACGPVWVWARVERWARNTGRL